LSNPSVSGVSFTGSTRTGSKIGELAGKNLKKSKNIFYYCSFYYLFLKKMNQL